MILGDNTAIKIFGKGMLSIDGKNPTKYVLNVEGLKKIY